MSYDKNTWQTGDVITATKLNHMEDGIAGAGGGVYNVTILYDDHNDYFYLDKNYNEIADAIEDGKTVIVGYENGHYFIISYGIYVDGYHVITSLEDTNEFYSADATGVLIHGGIL